jgi:hypothetical protein
MTSRNFFCCLAMVVSLCLGKSAVSRAADITVDVPASMVTRGIEREITRYIQNRQTRLDWLPETFRRVEASVSGAGENIMRVRLFMTFATVALPASTEVPVTVTFRITFDCSARGPFLMVHGTTVAAPGISVPPAVIREIQAEANHMLRDRTHGIINELWQNLIAIGGPHAVCPQFRIGPRGDIRAELDFRRGCVNGRTRHEPCGANLFGNGFDYTCRNGKWRRSGGWCEPSAPPDGRRR